MKEPKQYSCPLTQQPCNDMCTWADIQYTLDEQGVSRDVYCAVAVIAGWCLEQGGGIDYYIE